MSYNEMMCSTSKSVASCCEADASWFRRASPTGTNWQSSVGQPQQISAPSALVMLSTPVAGLSVTNDTPVS